MGVATPPKGNSGALSRYGSADISQNPLGKHSSECDGPRLVPKHLRWRRASSRRRCLVRSLSIVVVRCGVRSDASAPLVGAAAAAAVCQVAVVVLDEHAEQDLEHCVDVQHERRARRRRRRRRRRGRRLERLVDRCGGCGRYSQWSRGAILMWHVISTSWIGSRADRTQRAVASASESLER